MQWNQVPSSETSTPGWYPDPSNPAVWRWWDGTGWTEHTAPRGGPAGTGTGGKRTTRILIGLGVGLAVLVVVLGVVTVFGIVRFSGKAVDWVTEPMDTVNGYLAAVEAGDFAEADAMTCSGSEEFEIDFTEEGGDALVRYDAYRSQRVNSRAWVMFDYETEAGSGTAVAHLEPHDGTLQICDITSDVPFGVFEDDPGGF